jgi:hypothetical protein
MIKKASLVSIKETLATNSHAEEVPEDVSFV